MMECFAIGADNCALLDMLSDQRKAVLLNAICAALRGDPTPDMDEATSIVFKVLEREQEQFCSITKSSQTLHTVPTDQERIKKKVSPNGDTKEKKERTADTLMADDRVAAAFDEFARMRKMIKKPLTDLATKRAVNKIHTLSADDPERAVAILNQSVDHCWQDLYELKDDAMTKPLTKTQSAYGQRSEKVQRAYGFSTERKDVDYNAIALERARRLWEEEDNE